MRILIVDDDALVATSLRQVLELLGHEASVVSQPGMAIEAHRCKPADVLLLDWNMQGGGGMRVISALEARAVPPAHIIVVTGTPAASLPEEARSRPVLHKPFRVHQLVKMLAELAVLPGSGEEGATHVP